MIVILPTKYDITNTLRVNLFKETLKELHLKRIQTIVVDSSTNYIYNDIKETISLYNNSLNENIKLMRQKDISGKKGGAIREGIKYILDNFQTNDVIVFQEPEKVDMIQYYENIIADIKEDTYACIPSRTNESFKSYPKEQQCSEIFMNYYLNSLTGYDFDWAFGPIILTQNISKYWLKYNGKMWDAQIIPILYCFRDNIKVIDRKLDFKYPENQEDYEEDNLEFIRKRYYQLTYIIDRFEKKYIK